MGEIDKNIIAEAIEWYGEETQQVVCMEECCELAQAISKKLRGKLANDNLVEEIADVLICIETLKQIYLIHDEDIEDNINHKLIRLKQRIEVGGNV